MKVAAPNRHFDFVPLHLEKQHEDPVRRDTRCLERDKIWSFAAWPWHFVSYMDKNTIYTRLTLAPFANVKVSIPLLMTAGILIWKTQLNEERLHTKSSFFRFVTLPKTDASGCHYHKLARELNLALPLRGAHRLTNRVTTILQAGKTLTFSDPDVLMFSSTNSTQSARLGE